MILAIALTAASLALGFLVAKKINSISFWEKVFYAPVIGTMLATWAVFLPARALELNSASLFLSLLVLLAVCLALSRWKMKKHAAPKSVERAPRAPLPPETAVKLPRLPAMPRPLLCLVVFSLAFGGLFYSRALEERSDGLYSVRATWPDMSFHLTIINSFEQNANPNLEYPLFVGMPLGYPFLFDFYTAALLKGGIPITWVVFFQGVLYSLAFVGLLYFFTYRLLKRSDAAFLAVLAVIFSGGLGFIYFMQEMQSVGGTVLTKDYTQLSEHGIEWTNVRAELIPQRHLPLGWGAMLIVFSLLLAALEKTDAGKNAETELLFAGAVAGLLPLFHFHAFVSILVVIVCFALLFRRVDWKWFVLPLIVAAAPQVTWTFQQLLVGKGFMNLNFWWMAEDENLLVFWIKNLGLNVLLAVPAFFLAENKIKKIYLCFLSLFVLGNIFSFQPWAYDNIKIMYVWFFANAALVAWALVKMCERGVAWRALAIVLFAATVFSGMLSLVWSAQESFQLYSKEEHELGEWLKANTPKEAVFLTSDMHNHPVSMLAGRRILAGYEGWLWSHGIPHHDRQADVRKMFAGGSEALKLMKRYHAAYGLSYAAIGDGERSLGANEKFFDENFKLVKQTPRYKIYKLS